MAKNRKKDKLEDNGVSGELHPPILEVTEGDNGNEFEEIVKTTDSMTFMAAQDSFKNKKNSKFMESSREAISQSYELARRRINSTYEDIIDGGAFVGIQFLAVQLVLINYDKEWDVKKVEHAITIFVRSIIEKISIGIGVALSEDLVFESVVYVNKILPASKMTPSFAQLVSAITWKELFNELIRENKLTIADRDVIEDLTIAVDENVKRGYYIQLLDMIISRVNMERSDTILLYSYDTLLKMNREYKRHLSIRKQGVKTISNEANNYSSTMSAITKSQFEKNKDRSDSQDESDGFVPNDDADVVQPPAEYLENFTFEMKLSEKQLKRLKKQRENNSDTTQTINDFVDDISSEMTMTNDELAENRDPVQADPNEASGEIALETEEIEVAAEEPAKIETSDETQEIKDVNATSPINPDAPVDGATQSTRDEQPVQLNDEVDPKEAKKQAKEDAKKAKEDAKKAKEDAKQEAKQAKEDAKREKNSAKNKDDDSGESDDNDDDLGISLDDLDVE